MKCSRNWQRKQEEAHQDQVSVVGNTCMHHLSWDSASLVHAPYNPAISQGLTLNAEQYGLHIHRKGLFMLPDIAGYVGQIPVAAFGAQTGSAERDQPYDRYWNERGRWSWK